MSVKLLPLFLLAVSAPVLAQPTAGELTLAGADEPGDYDQGLSGIVAFGYTATSGNTETSTLDLRASLTYGAGQWYHTASVEQIRSTDDGMVTAKTLEAKGQSDYLFNARNYVFAHVGYTNTRFTGVQRRLVEAVGYGHRILDSDAFSWSAQVGAGARQSDIQNDGSRNSAIVQLASKFSWQFAENSELGQDVLVERGTDNTHIETTTSLTLKVIDNFALVLAYQIRYNSQVPPEAEKRDTYTSVSLQYTF